MKYIKNVLLLVIALCMLFSINIYAQTAKTGDVLVTSNDSGTPQGKIFTNAAVTVSNLDTSNNYKYYGIDIGAFKKPTTGTDWTTTFVERIATDSPTVTISDFGDRSRYEYEGVYALGYRVLYQAIGSSSNPILEMQWQMIPDSYFVVKPIVFSISAPVTNQVFDTSLNISGKVQCPTGNVLKVKYRFNLATGDGTQLGSDITTDATEQVINENINTSSMAEADYTLYIWAEDNFGGKSPEVIINLRKFKQAESTSDYVYFKSSSSGIGVKINKDIPENQLRVTEGQGWDVLSDGEYSYYTDSNGKIYKMNETTGVNTQIYDGKAKDLWLTNGYIYFFNETEHIIKKIKTDGTGLASIKSTWNVRNIIADTNGYYYVYTFEGRHDLVDKNGNIIANNVDENSRMSMSYDGLWIYYKKINDGIYKVKIDGTEPTRVISQTNLYSPVIDVNGNIYTLELDSVSTYSYINRNSVRLTSQPVAYNNGGLWVVRPDKVLPTLSSSTVSGTGYYGEGVTVAAAGANINLAAYRIFYTTSSTAPAINPTADYSSPGSGWMDSGKAGDMVKNSDTSISKDLLGTDFVNTSWTYIVFKIGAGSWTGNWVFTYSEAYKLTNDPNNPINPTNPPGDGTYSAQETYIDNISYNQVLSIEGTKTIVVSDPYTPIDTYTITDISEVNSWNTFVDNDYLTYRIEFNALKPEKIRDMKLLLDFNSFNEDGIEVFMRDAKLYSIFNNTLVPRKSLNGLYTRQGRKNRYVLTIGNDDNGISILQANGKGKYVIEIGCIIQVKKSLEDSLSLIKNEVQIGIYTGNNNYSGIDPYLPSNKTYIETRVSRSGVGYR